MLLEFQHFIFNVRFLVILPGNRILFTLSTVCMIHTYKLMSLYCLHLEIDHQEMFQLEPSIYTTKKESLWISISSLMKI